MVTGSGEGLNGDPNSGLSTSRLVLESSEHTLHRGRRFFFKSISFSTVVECEQIPHTRLAGAVLFFIYSSIHIPYSMHTLYIIS